MGACAPLILKFCSWKCKSVQKYLCMFQETYLFSRGSTQPTVTMYLCNLVRAAPNQHKECISQITLFFLRGLTKLLYLWTKWQTQIYFLLRATANEKYKNNNVTLISASNLAILFLVLPKIVLKERQLIWNGGSNKLWVSSLILNVRATIPRFTSTFFKRRKTLSFTAVTESGLHVITTRVCPYVVCYKFICIGY